MLLQRRCLGKVQPTDFAPEWPVAGMRLQVPQHFLLAAKPILGPVASAVSPVTVVGCLAPTHVFGTKVVGEGGAGGERLGTAGPIACMCLRTGLESWSKFFLPFVRVWSQGRRGGRRIRIGGRWGWRGS
jgi:hypothetical protein